MPALNGKPGGCMDIDTLLCFDCTDPGAGGDVNSCDVQDDFERVDCDGENLSNDVFVLTGHLDVDRSKGRPRWQDATSELLGSTGVHLDDYFDFLWSIFNSGLRHGAASDLQRSVRSVGTRSPS